MSRCCSRSGGVPARLAPGVVLQSHRLPAPLQLDRRHHHRAGLPDQRLGLLEQRVGFLRLRRAAVDRLDTVPGQPRHAAVPVLGAVGEPAQRALLDDPLGGGQPHRRMRRGKRQFDQQRLLDDRLDRGTPLLAIGHVVQPAAERLDDRRAHLRLGVGLPGAEERRAVGAASCGGGAHLGGGVGPQQLQQLGGIGRQFGHAEQALRRLGVLVQRRAGEDLVQHGRIDSEGWGSASAVG
ncbi:MAG: hypothetical protein MUF32_06260 [Burkholderiaceae bacterium]|nr:hypothetical protein [Burkholderiaceae bacterium]